MVALFTPSNVHAFLMTRANCPIGIWSQNTKGAHPPKPPTYKGGSPPFATPTLHVVGCKFWNRNKLRYPKPFNPIHGTFCSEKSYKYLESNDNYSRHWALKGQIVQYFTFVSVSKSLKNIYSGIPVASYYACTPNIAPVSPTLCFFIRRVLVQD